MWGIRSISRLARQGVRQQSRRQMSVKDLYPDRAAARARPDYNQQSAGAFEAGEDGAMEYMSLFTVMLTIGAFMYLPFAKSHQTLDMWARLEAKKRLEMKEDGDEAEYGTWHHEADIQRWGKE